MSREPVGGPNIPVKKDNKDHHSQLNQGTEQRREVISANNFDELYCFIERELESNFFTQHQLKQAPFELGPPVGNPNGQGLKCLAECGPLLFVEVEEAILLEADETLVSLLEKLAQYIYSLKRKDKTNNPFSRTEKVFEGWPHQSMIDDLTVILKKIEAQKTTPTIFLEKAELNKVLDQVQTYVEEVSKLTREEQPQRFFMIKFSTEDLRILLQNVSSLVNKIASHKKIEKRVPKLYGLADRRCVPAEEDKIPAEKIDVSFDYRLMPQYSRQQLPEALQSIEKISIPHGSMVLIVGPNGSGKTVLANTIEVAALYYQNPVNHRKISKSISDQSREDLPGPASWEAKPELARCIDIKGLRHQNKYNSVIYVDFAKWSQRMERTMRMGSNDALKNVLFQQHMERRSKGELQREMMGEVASRLKTYEGLAIFDEPDTGLDAWSLRDMKDQLRALAHHATILVITHNPCMVFDAEMPRFDLRFPGSDVHLNPDEAIFSSAGASISTLKD